ncbi:NodB homology domain-containing protein OS=Streptomyces fumanus OX=67302 GN=GCM10018772_41190 PE=4 SV=1 [Streptomyces fumanus]
MRGRRTGAGPRRRALVRGALGLLCVAVVALPFTLAWRYDALHRAVAAQAPAPAAGAAPVPRVAAPAAAPPVVLAYHDVGDERHGRFTVSPRRLDTHLRALREAGYRTLSTREFTAYLRTGRAPAPRSVYLTFDDGAHGLWVHADPILRRYGMRAAAFLITGRVGTHRPYYLTWPEIGRMAESGRWDFQTHTDDGHDRAPVDATGHRASVFGHRLWLAAERRRETVREYRRRIAADLDRSVRAVTAHGLPRPELFAHPFSEATDGTDARVLDAVLRERFTAALTNSARRPLPPGPRAAAAGQVQRTAVTRGTTAAALLRSIARQAPVAPGAAGRPLERAGDWEFPDDMAGTGVGALTGKGPYPPGHRYIWAGHRPVATADWTSYRLRAAVSGLRGPGTGAGITVRAGSGHPVKLTVGRGAARLAGQGRVRSCRLDPAAGHGLAVTVTPAQVRVSVDGRPCALLRAHRRDEAEGAGGFALDVRDDDRSGHWPAFTSLTVE